MPKIKEWVDEQYKNGRVTCIGDTELERAVVKQHGIMTWYDGFVYRKQLRWVYKPDGRSEISLPDIR